MTSWRSLCRASRKASAAMRCRSFVTGLEMEAPGPDRTGQCFGRRSSGPRWQCREVACHVVRHLLEDWQASAPDQVAVEERALWGAVELLQHQRGLLVAAKAAVCAPASAMLDVRDGKSPDQAIVARAAVAVPVEGGVQHVGVDPLSCPGEGRGPLSKAEPQRLVRGGRARRSVANTGYRKLRSWFTRTLSSCSPVLAGGPARSEGRMSTPHLALALPAAGVGGTSW